MSTIIALIIAYLIGSLSGSIILSKIMKTPDPRTQGSGNAGATNVLRTLGKQRAFMVLAVDLIKGLLAIWIGYLFHLHHFFLGLVGLAAVLGHVFPLYFKFKGGKGVATTIGATLGLSFISGILIGAVWVAIALTLRYASLASLITVILAPVFLLIFSSAAYFIPFAMIAALIIWQHKDNIERLRNKTEDKISLSF